jgi:hypothetical protein
MSKGDLEKEAVRTTIVGGRPPGSGRNFTMNVPRGIEVLVKKAAVDPEFRQLLLAQRGAAAASIGLELDPAESAILGAISEDHLARIICQTVVPAEQRHVLLGRVAAATLVALGAGLATGRSSEASMDRTEPGTYAPPSTHTSGSLYAIGGGGSGGAGPARPSVSVLGPGPHGASGGPNIAVQPARELIVITDNQPAPATPATRSPLDWNDPAAVGRLVQDLGDSDYGVRERGQKTLDAIPSGEYQKVHDLAEKAADPEAKSRLAAREDAMIMDCALNPPAISLEVKDATLAEVAAALSKALGVPLKAVAPSPAYGDERYTISVKNWSFGQILKAAPLWVNADARGDLSLLRDPAPWDVMQVNGGVCIAIDGPRKAPVVARATSVSTGSAIALALDPRVTVSEIRPPEILSATDQAGRPASLRVPPATPAANKAAAQRHVLMTSMTWSQPTGDTVAVTSVSITGRWTLVVSAPDPASKTGAMKDVPVTIPFEFKQLPVH